MSARIHTATVRRIGVRLASLCLGLALLSGTAIAQAEQPFEVNIKAQDLSSALTAFGRQTKTEIAFIPDVVGSTRAPAVKGEMTRVEILETLLAETSLEYRYMDNGTVIVQNAGVDEESANDSKNLRSTPALMAQNQTPATQNQTNSSEISKENESIHPLEEIIVVGTHIRGVGPVGSPVIAIDRQEIDRTGFATTQDIIQSIPQNFGGGTNEDSGIFNQDAGSGINLRGLGNVATLTLLNGRRIPVAGTSGDFTDVSMIPATAIDRIEVLTDGASAIYGADAIAGVVNVILRDDFDGAETRARIGTVTEGGTEEIQLGQTFGATWENGRALISYEYYEREPLFNSDRDYAASSDLTSFGGDNFNDFATNPGNILDPATFFQTIAFAIPPGQDGTSLAVDDLLPAPQEEPGNRNKGKALLPEQKRHSVFVTATQTLGDAVSLFAEGSFSRRDYLIINRGAPRTLIVPSSNAFFVDPFGGSSSIRVDYNLFDDLGPENLEGNVEFLAGVLGMQAAFGRDWQLEVYGSYSERTRSVNFLGQPITSALNAALADSNPSTAFNPFGDGSNTNPATIESVRAARRQLTESDVMSANLKVDGSLFELRGSDVGAAVGFEYREETLGNKTFEAGLLTTDAKYKKDLSAFFGEIYLPLFSDTNRRPGLEQLTLSASVRYEDYSGQVDASDTNPRFGVLWTPLQGLDVRASYGTSFRTPSLRDLDVSDGRAAALLLLWPDPASPTGVTNTLIEGGNNADLANETATTWTVGFDFSPLSMPELEFGLTYFDVEFEDRIAQPANIFGILSNEEQFANIITRDPIQAQLDSICDSALFIGDPALCLEGSVLLILDIGLNNTARTKVSGLDFTASYGFETDNIGRFDFRLNSSYLLKFEEAFTPSSSLIELLNTVGNPVDLRLRSSVGWSNDKRLAATAFVNYMGAYTDNASSPERKIDSWTSVDLNLSYTTESEFTYSLNAQNLFDADPPFVNNGAAFVGYDPANANPLGRFISFNIVKSW